jgi:gamma-glutamyltranspeptidase / glutathione hydrolase
MEKIMSYPQHRGVVTARKGMVAASQPLAVSAGLQILQSGGSFIDAAIAVSSVLAVTEPYASHIGGDAFVITYESASGRVTAFNASGAAPLQATLDRFEQGIPVRGMTAASVPGLPSCWFELHSRFGTRPMAQLLASAIDYAEAGFPAGYKHTKVFNEHAALINDRPETASALAGGAIASPLRPGRMVRQPDLAWTLKQIAKMGRSAFYNGCIMERILQASQAEGALFTAEDFLNHQTQVSDAIRVDYRGHRVYGQPPVSQGHILLQQLAMLQNFDIAPLGHNSPDVIHLQTEAKKRAFADRHAYLGDPSFVNVPMDWLLSDEYARQRSSEIDICVASDPEPGGPPPSTDHDTTYFCITDGEGNAVSFIQSVFWVFGSAAVAPGTGILFNNRMTGFSLDPESPNVLAPGKRTAHTLNAYLVTRPDPTTGKEPLAFVGGTPGGDIQVQSNMQVVCNVIDFGMNAQQAVEAPRWQHGGSVGAPGETAAETLAIESRVPEATYSELESRGHKTAQLAPWGHGSSYQLIIVDSETGAFMAGSDPRCDGHAAGF